jgi:hypothetical protein
VTSSKSSMLWALEYKEKGCSKQTSTAPLEVSASRARAGCRGR